MRLTFYAAVLMSSLFLMLPHTLHAQDSTTRETEEQEAEALPQWLVDFSNLPGETRDEYIRKFQQAKYTYQQGRWIDCIALLAECEIILRGNPNIWNLRACCLLEQKYLDEATAELQKVLDVMPNDAVTIMNLAHVHMAAGRYAESLAIVTRLREDLYLQHADDALLYTLDYRALLCHLMLGQEDKAKAIARSVTPMADTPLYLYAKASLALHEGRVAEALHQLDVVKRIFANNKAYVPYERSLHMSGLLDKLSQPTPPAS